jgi:hypothetical protein
MSDFLTIRGVGDVNRAHTTVTGVSGNSSPTVVTRAGLSLTFFAALDFFGVNSEIPDGILMQTGSPTGLPVGSAHPGSRPDFSVSNILRSMNSLFHVELPIDHAYRLLHVSVV